MDQIDPRNDHDASDGVPGETPGYTPVDDTTYEPNDGTAPENPDHATETVGGGEAVGPDDGTGAGDQRYEEVAEGNTAPHDH